MPDNYVDITVRAQDSSAVLNLDELKQKLNELGRKVETARVNLAGDKEAQASLTRMEAKLLGWGRRVATAKLKVDGVARAEADIAAVGLSLDKLGSKSAVAESAVGSGGLAGPGGMGALIAAGGALSPVLVTLGFGVAGFGAAAYGVVAPIEKAAKASGGLRANLGKLDPEQRAVARGLLGLGQQYRVFSDSLKPQVLGAFGEGLKIAGHLMTDTLPVAKSFGNALDQLLSRVDAEFQGGSWQQFFTWMGQQAGPDMQLVGTALINLTDALPGLLEGLQPVAVEMLKVADAGSKVVAVAGRLSGAAVSASKSTNLLERSGGILGKTLTLTTFPSLLGLQFIINKLAGSTKTATASSDIFRPALAAVGSAAAIMTGKIRLTAAEVTTLMKNEQAALSVQTTYAGDLVTTANDAKSLRDALKASSDRIGLHTQKQRDSFAAANTYITDLGNQASAAIASGKGVDVASGAIRRGLPLLESVKGKTAAYRAELAALKAMLDRLRAEANIVKTIEIRTFYTNPGTGTGIGSPGGGPGGHGGPPGSFGSAMAPAAGGLASSVMASAAAAASAFATPLARYHRPPDYGPRPVTNEFMPARGWPRPPRPVRITNGAELIAILADLLREHSRTHYGGSAQRAYGYGPG